MKRKLRGALRWVRASLRTHLWFLLLMPLAPLRHRLSLRKEGIPDTLRSRKRATGWISEQVGGEKEITEASMRPKTILITGSSGLIGSEAVEYFDGQGTQLPAMLPRRFEQVQSSSAFTSKSSVEFGGPCRGMVGLRNAQSGRIGACEIHPQWRSVPNIDVIVGKIFVVTSDASNSTQCHPRDQKTPGAYYYRLPMITCPCPSKYSTASDPSTTATCRLMRIVLGRIEASVLSLLPPNLLTDPSKWRRFLLRRVSGMPSYEDSTYGAEASASSKGNTGAFAAMLAPTAMHLAVFLHRCQPITIYFLTSPSE